MAILEALFEWLVEAVFEVFLDLFFELLKKLLLAIWWVVSGLARLVSMVLGGRRGPVYFQTGKSPREPAQRGMIFSPTRRRR